MQKDSYLNKEEFVMEDKVGVMYVAYLWQVIVDSP